MKGDIKQNSWAEKLGAEILEEQDHVYDEVVADDITLGNFEREQVVEACRLDLNFLAAVSMPTVFKFDFPPVLLATWQLLTDSAQSITKIFTQLALGIPRGHAKTTMVKLYILYCILFTKKSFILVISSTASNAENIIADVADMLNELNIIHVFGDWKLGLEINRQELKKFGFRGRDIIIGGLGAGGSIRGLNVKNRRPDVMIFDDVQTKECAESIQQSAALERWMIGTAMKAKSPTGCIFIFVGNMYPGTNSILKKLKTNPTWIKVISGAILSDYTALWPELHSLEDLIQELNNDMSMGHPEIFFSEVLNDTEAGINTRTDFNKIKPWPWAKIDQPQGKFILVDPANNKKGGDDVSIGYFEVYDSIPGCREVIEENLSPGNTIRQALVMALRTRTKIIAIEANAYQYSLLYWFGEICNSLEITGIEVVPVYSGSYSKNSRITDMLKALTSGEIMLHEEVRSKVLFQISNWNPLKRDNTDGLLDLLAYAPRVLELYGPSIATDTDLDTIDSNETKVEEYNSCF